MKGLWKIRRAEHTRHIYTIVTPPPPNTHPLRGWMSRDISGMMRTCVIVIPRVQGFVACLLLTTHYAHTDTSHYKRKVLAWQRFGKSCPKIYSVKFLILFNNRVSIYNSTALKKLTINFLFFFLVFTSAKHEWKLREKCLRVKIKSWFRKSSWIINEFESNKTAKRIDQRKL